ncbi:MAG: hypothetical protein ABR889_07160 [Acidobacteriaceae bacterium]
MTHSSSHARPNDLFSPLGLSFFGLADGAYWHGLFTGFLPALIVLAAICLAYITVVWWKQ